MTALPEGYEYWRKREERNLKRLKKEEKDWEDQIDQIYQRMISELDDEIALFYSRFANNAEMSMAEAVKYLKKTDIDWYAARAKFYCELAAKDFAEGTDKRASIYFSDEANEEMLRYNATMRISRLEMLKSQMKLRILKAQSKAEETIDMALWQRTYETFEHQAGILGNTVLDDIQPMVETIARASFHGQEFSKRIWGKQQTLLQKQLNKALSECLILGKGAAPFTRKLQKIGNTTKEQASRLMRTELARVQTQAEHDAYEKCGFNDFMYLTNPSCCPECRKHDGRTYPMRKMEPGKTAPPLHPNCRCFTAPTVSRERVEKDLGIDEISDEDVSHFDEWMADYEKSGIAWDEWKKSKSRLNVTGARIIDPNSKGATKWAENYYEEIRHKTTDYKKIAKRINVPEEDVLAVKDYLFNDKSWLNPFTNKHERFSADAAIAQSWQRLAEGKNIEPHDLTLINHELLEIDIKKKNPQLSHREAHDLAEKEYNYSKDSGDYYDKRKERKKNK